MGDLYPGMAEHTTCSSDKYEILGSDMQVLHLAVAGGEDVQTEPGTMLYMSPDIKYDVNLNDCLGRCLSGNCCIMGVYHNNASDPKLLGITPNFPAKVIPLELGGGNKYQCKSGSYLSGTGSAKLGYDFDFNPLICCCGGQGCVRQNVTGEGVAFINAMGTIMTKNLAADEVIVIDTQSAVAWDATATLGVRPAGSFGAICCGGEGCFNTTLTGPGQVYVQSMSFEKFKKALKTQVQKKKDKAGNSSGHGAPASFGMAR